MIAWGLVSVAVALMVGSVCALGWYVHGGREYVWWVEATVGISLMIGPTLLLGLAGSIG